MGPAVRRRPARMAPMLGALRSRCARCSSNRKETMPVMKKIVVSIVIITVLLHGGCLFAQSEIGGAPLKGGVSGPFYAVFSGGKGTVHRTERGLKRTMGTKKTGLYRLGGVPVGSCELTV